MCSLLVWNYWLCWMTFREIKSSNKITALLVEKPVWGTLDTLAPLIFTNLYKIGQNIDRYKRKLHNLLLNSTVCCKYHPLFWFWFHHNWPHGSEKCWFVSSEFVGSLTSENLSINNTRAELPKIVKFTIKIIKYQKCERPILTIKVSFICVFKWFFATHFSL